MKAWQIGPLDQEWVAIVHAPTRGKAKMMVNFEVGDYLYIRAVRAPLFDDSPITLELLEEAGFPMEWGGTPTEPGHYNSFCGCGFCRFGTGAP